MAFVFNGSTFSFGGDVAEVRSMTYDTTAAEIDVTNAADTLTIFEVGTLNATATLEINGQSTIDIGDANALLTMVWNSGGANDTMTLGVVTGKSVTGSVDGGIVTTLTFKNGQ